MLANLTYWKLQVKYLVFCKRDLAKKQRQNTCFTLALTFPVSSHPADLHVLGQSAELFCQSEVLGSKAELQPLGELSRAPLLLTRLSS